MQVVNIVLAFLQINLDWLRLVFRFAHKSGISPAATNIRVTADMTQHFAELIRTFPRDGEGTDSSGGYSAHGSIGWIL